jgi:hypothetical protein
MNVSEIREMYRATPFQPFEIVLTNGSTVQVGHPEFMGFSPDYRTIYAWDIRGGGAKRIDVKLVIALNELPPQSKGKNKKR